MTFRNLATLCLVMLSSAALVGCSERPTDMDGSDSMEMPALQTRADSVAMTVYEAHGGPEAWAALPYLRFNFGGADNPVRHFWDRNTGDYRVEMPAGEDSVFVALFNVNTREGDVYLNGEALGGERESEWLDTAYRRFINDTYWLLMPVKLFDPGVNRTYVADSSNAERDVLHLTFGEVGLTPGDQYWVYVDTETGLIDAWAYHLQGHPDDHVPQPISWSGYTTLDTPNGEIVVSEEKPRNGSVLYTNNVAVPTEAPDGIFTNPQPML